MPCLVTVSGYYGRRQGGYVSACVHLVVGGSVSRITQKLQWGFPLNLDRGGLVFPKKFNTVWYWIRLYDIKGDRWALVEECPSLKEEPFHARKTYVSGGKWNQCIANKLNPLLSGIMMKWLIFHLSGRIMTSSCEYQLVNLIVFLWLLGCGQTTRNASIRSTSLLFRRVPSCGVMEHNKHEIPRGL